MIGDRCVCVRIKDLMHRIDELAAICRYRRDIITAASDLLGRDPAAAAEIPQDHRRILLRSLIIGNDLIRIPQLLRLDRILTILQIQRQTVFRVSLI